MNRKIVSLFISAVILIGLMAGCTGGKTTPSTAPVMENVDLEKLYEKGMASYAEKGKEAPALYIETDEQMLNELYPGIGSIKLKQSYFAMAYVTNAPTEFALVEVENKDDVKKVIDIFQARVDDLSEDDGYPENSAVWKNCAKVTSRGNYVFLSVMPDEYGIPAEFILD